VKRLLEGPPGSHVSLLVDRAGDLVKCEVERRADHLPIPDPVRAPPRGVSWCRRPARRRRRWGRLMVLRFLCLMFSLPAPRLGSASSGSTWPRAATSRCPPPLPTVAPTRVPTVHSPLPTVAPTRVPTVHSSPPYCCPYPCPYCTLLPSLLLPLPVSLLYTRMMATAPPAARPPSCAPRRRRAPEPRPSTAPLYAGCRVPGGLGCPQRGGARRRRADGGRRGRGAGPREPRASSPRPDHALDWFRERTRRVVFERHALAHRPGPTQRGGPARCLAWTLHRSLSASRASQGALPPSFASLSMAPGAHGKTDPPGLSRTPIAVGPPQSGPPNDRSVVILTVGREVDGEPDLKLLDCSVEHRA
jgi:hypothetical protein